MSNVIVNHEDGHWHGTLTRFDDAIEVTAAGDVQDEGGYWEGTDNQAESQNRMVRRASTRRSSVMEIQNMHGVAIMTMQDRFPDVPIHTLIRFLKARDYDIKKATAMYQAHAEWRQKTFPLPSQHATATLSTRKFYMLDDLDEDGRPVILYCLNRFKETPYVVEDEIEALLYLLESQVIPRFGPSFETQRFTVLINVSGIRSPPISFLQSVNTVMEANYPETLHRTIMFPVPYWLRKTIQALTSFLAEETRKKLAYVNDIKSLAELAGMPIEKMGPDITELVQTKQLKK